MESEANMFASELLMPSGKFLEVFCLCSGDLAYLQETFVVSKEAIKYRSINLGLSIDFE